ncbi:MAG: hypothetical protein JNL98_15515 [Bryobacterales bacterium]|nr:hypothetical protein [Bryobacterales bacterium]
MLKRLVVPILAVLAVCGFSGSALAQVFSVTPQTVTFSTPSNTQVPNPASVSLVVVNPTSGGFTVSTNQTWLLASIASTLVNVSINTQVLATLAPGQYTGIVTVTPTVTTQAPVNVSVTLNIGNTGGGGGTPATTSPVSVAPNNLSFQSQAGGIPAAQVFNLTAPVGSSYSLSTTFASPFGLTATPSSGVTTAATTPITVSVTPGNLTPGIYSAAIQVQISNQITQVVVVSFAVGTNPGLTISPNVLTFSYQPGQAVPGNQSFNITAAQSGVQWIAFPNTVTGAAPGTTWLSLPNTSGTATPTAQVSVGLNAQAVQALQPGIYTALVQVSLTIPQPSQYVMVILQVGTTSGGGGGSGTGAQGVTFSPSSLTFNVLPGQNFPPQQQVTINAPQAFRIVLTPTTDSGGQWLALGPNDVTLSPTTSGFTASISVALFANVVSATPAEYTGRITVTQFGTNISLATIPVRLVVGSSGGGTGTGTGTASPSQLTYTFQSNGSNPPTQVLSLIPPGGTTTTYTAQIVGPGGAQVNWLQLEPASGTAPGAMAVRIINVGTLGPATYTATINITFAGSATPLSVPVTFVVQTTPSLRTSMNQVNFNYQSVSGSVPAGQGANIEVTSTGGLNQPVTFTATSAMTNGTGWLTVTPSSGTTPSTITASINATNLQPGIYTGTVTLTYAGGQNVIPITLNVSSNIPLLNPNVVSMAFIHSIGAANPAAQNLTIQTTGGTANVTPTVNQPPNQTWLSIAPLQQATTPVTFQVSVNPFGLAEGIYYGSIVFTAPAGTAANVPLVIPVALNVTGTANFVITPGPLTFTQFQGGGAPAAQTLNIASSGALLQYTVETSILTGSGWLSVNVNSGITPGTLQVTANGTQLAQGTYSGSVIIRSTGALNSPQVVPITLNVVAPPTVTATPTTITFSANTNNVVTPSTQAIDVRSSGAQITYQVQATVPAGQPQWLVVTPATGTTPGTITVSVNLAGLQPGIYNGTVTINTGLPQPISIPVQLNFQQVNPPVVTAVTNAASFLPTAVAPGMIVAIFGQNLGPQNLVRLRLTPAGTVDTTLETVRVTFDGIPAPLLFVRADVVSAVVPYGIGGRATVRLQVEHQGARSTDLSLRVVDAAPAIFTTNQQGDGQGAIQNSDFSVNSPGNPVARGQFAIIYFTGEGATSPGGIDGVISSASLLRSPIGRTEVRIGGQLAEVLYVGSVPTTVLGLAQVNVIVPPNAPTGGAVPVEVSVGGVASRPGVTMAVR